MDYLDFGDNIDYNKYNALVYLLRKFKKLTSNLTLGAYKLESDYGTFNFSDGFVNVGNNWILENPVTVTSNDVLKNTFYTFNFVVIDVNTTGTVNRRIVSVTAGTGETGTIELTIPQDLIGTDEVILPNFTLEVVFDEHEYYTQLPDIHLSLSVDKMGIEEGEVATITGLLTDSTSTPIENVRLPLNVGGTIVTVITDSTGEFNYAYTGTGTRGKVFVSALGESVFFYDGLINIMGAIVTGNNVSLGRNTNWLITTGDVVIYWGDGTSDTVNNPFTKLSHTYSDGLNEHLIIFDGTVTSLGDHCFYNCSGLTSIIIPDSVTSLGEGCFWGCSGLTSVTIPSSVTSLGTGCFRGCYGLTSVTIPSSVTSLGNQCFAGCSGLTSVTISDSVTSLGNQCFAGCSGLIDYELYWETQPIQYNSQKMPVNTGTVFTIPYGTIGIYTNAGYPLDKLVERTGTPTDLTLTGDKSVIQKTETATITALLEYDGSPVYNERLSYSVKHGSTVLDSGTLTTDINGQATITYTGTGVGDVSVEVTYGTLLQETYELEDNYWYDDATSDKSSSFVKLPSQNPTITYNTDHYTMVGDGNNLIYLGTEEYNNISFEVTMKLNNTGSGILVGGDEGWGANNLLAYRAFDYQYWFYLDNQNIWVDIFKVRPIMNSGTYYKMVVTISDNKYTHRIEDMNGNILKSAEATLSLPKKRLAIGLMEKGASIDVKEIKVKAL